MIMEEIILCISQGHLDSLGILAFGTQQPFREEARQPCRKASCEQVASVWAEVPGTASINHQTWGNETSVPYLE
jgi:hypothetical protein